VSRRTSNRDLVDQRPGGHRRLRIIGPPLGTRSFLRVDFRLMTSLAAGELSDREFRASLGLLSYVACFRSSSGREDAFPAEWRRFAFYAKPGQRRGRVTPCQVERFIELGLLRPLLDENGDNWLRIVDWRHAQRKPAAS
jgi:hypothetical protein